MSGQVWRIKYADRGRHQYMLLFVHSAWYAFCMLSTVLARSGTVQFFKKHTAFALQAAEAAIQQLEHKLVNDGTNWRLRFLKAKRAPQESFSEQFKQLARCCSSR